jgi:hypothetical protein
MLLRQTLLYLPAQVLGPIFQLISAFAWTHYLAPAEMGSFALISAAQELAFATILLWFSLYTVRYFDSDAHADDKSAFHATEMAVLLGSSVAMGLALAVIPLGQGGRLGVRHFAVARFISGGPGSRRGRYAGLYGVADGWAGCWVLCGAGDGGRAARDGGNGVDGLRHRSDRLARVCRLPVAVQPSAS